MKCPISVSPKDLIRLRQRTVRNIAHPQYLSAMRISFIHSPTWPLSVNKGSMAKSNRTSPSLLGSAKPYSAKRVEFGCEPYFKNNWESRDVTETEGDKRVKSCPNLCFIGGAISSHMSAGEVCGSVYGGLAVWLAKSRMGQRVILLGSERDRVIL